jgi:hypothetical protein
VTSPFSSSAQIRETVQAAFPEPALLRRKLRQWMPPNQTGRPEGSTPYDLKDFAERVHAVKARWLEDRETFQ